MAHVKPVWRNLFLQACAEGKPLEEVQVLSEGIALARTNALEVIIEKKHFHLLEWLVSQGDWKEAYLCNTAQDLASFDPLDNCPHPQPTLLDVQLPYRRAS